MSGMFYKLYLEDPSTGHRRLTRVGWLQLAGLVFGFILFGLTEARDQQKAVADRLDSTLKQAQQASQIDTLKQLLNAQQVIQRGQDTQITQGKTLQLTQTTLIQNQGAQNRRLKDVLLASYQLSGVEVGLALSPLTHQRYAALFQATKEDLKASGQAPSGPFEKSWQYFETCIEHGDFHATKGERDQWDMTCRLARPQGIASPNLYCAPDTYQWRVFEGFLDMVLGARFAIQLSAGPDLVLLSTGSRPSRVTRNGNRIILTIIGTPVKLGQLNDAKITLRVDKPVFLQRELFTSVTIRSLDPLVQFDVTMSPVWEPTKIGTEKVLLDVADQPQDVDVVVQMAQPTRLPITINRKLLAAEK